MSFKYAADTVITMADSCVTAGEAIIMAGRAVTAAIMAGRVAAIAAGEPTTMRPLATSYPLCWKHRDFLDNADCDAQTP